MPNSPLIYEVLLSGCLINPVQKTRPKHEEAPLRPSHDALDHEPDDEDHIMTNAKEDMQGCSHKK